MSQVFLSSTAGGSVDSLVVAADSGTASPSGGLLNVVTPGGGTHGISTSASGNTVTVTVTPSGVSGTTTTIGAVTGDMITFACGATPGTYIFEFKTAGFDTTPAGVGYNNIVTVRTTGAAASIIGVQDKIVFEESGLTAADVSVVVSANNVILRATGVAGRTINWSSTGVYVFAS